jgi:hypothetical protein
MTLPHPKSWLIEQRKLRDYLLSPVHPIGRFKAVFFGRLGFTPGNWQSLEAKVRRISQECEVALGPATPFGQKYLI